MITYDCYLLGQANHAVLIMVSH